MIDNISIVDCLECMAVNTELASNILQLSEAQYCQRTHLFNGRFENLYIEASRLPGLEQILDYGLQKASELLERKANDLKFGFWLNIMHRGDVTTLHRHDDDDELLSAVYYVQADEQAAVFRFHNKGEVQEISPKAGRFMFFDPGLPHEVSRHESDTPRISIGINFGPVDN